MLAKEEMYESRPQDQDWTIKTGQGSMLRDLLGEHHYKGEGHSSQLPSLSGLF